MNLYIITFAARKICYLTLRQIDASIYSHLRSIFSFLKGKLLSINIFDSMKHFIDRLTYNEELLWCFCNPQSIVETLIKKIIFGVKLKNIGISKRVFHIVIHSINVLSGSVWCLALFYKSFFRKLHIARIKMKIHHRIDVISISYKLSFIFASQFHEIRKSNFIDHGRLCFDIHLFHIFLHQVQNLFIVVIDHMNFIVVFVVS